MHNLAPLARPCRDPTDDRAQQRDNGYGEDRPRDELRRRGPNFGFTISPSDADMACPNGSWKPGRYDFLTRTRHIRSGVVAVATLGWTKKKAC